MTVLAGKFVAVGHAVGLKCSDNRGMAFDAISGAEMLWLRGDFGTGHVGAKALACKERK